MSRAPSPPSSPVSGYYKRPPEKGIAVFCGTVKLYGDRTDLQCTIIEPPEPLNLYMYRCSSSFELEPLKQMLEEKYVYGLLVLDKREAYWGFLRGNRIEPMGGANSTVPGKMRKGGQSAARFGRLREIAIDEFYTKVGERSSAIFLAEKNFFERFKGVLIGGPSPTKEEFEKGNYLHHEVQKRIIGLFDVAYTNEDGLSELVDAAKDALKGMTVIKEKAFMDRFLRGAREGRRACRVRRGEHPPQPRDRCRGHPPPLRKPPQVAAQDQVPEL